jgi:hypothetical protein
MAAQQRAPRSPLSFFGSVSDVQIAARNRASALSVDAAGSRFWFTLLLVGLCQLADLISFNFAVQTFGPGGELGPLGLVYEATGFLGVAVVKLGLIAIVMAVLARYPWQRLATRRRMALIVAAIGVFGAFTNVMAFFWLV